MCWVFVAACELSLVALSGCCSPGAGLSCCGARALGTWTSGVVVQHGFDPSKRGKQGHVPWRECTPRHAWV